MSFGETVAESLAVGNGLRTTFDEHSASLLRLCTLLTGQRAEAEDLVQESFIRLAPKLGSLPADSVWPYLRRIAVNLWKNRLRRLRLEAARARHREIEPASLGSAIEEHDWVWAALLQLPRRQRACIVLRFYEDLTEAQTAAVLGCALGTVKSQSAKALARLTEVLSDGD